MKIFNRHRYNSEKAAIVLSLFVLFVFLGCEAWLPTAYQEEEFILEGSGKGACDFFASDSGMVLQTVSFPSAVMDSMWIDADQNLIDTTFSALLPDQVYRIKNEETQDTLYTIFSLPAGVETKEILIFITYELTAQNIETFVNLDLFEKNGKIVGPVYSDLSPETIAGCTQKVTIGGLDVRLPSIRTKYRTQLSESPVLIRFSMSEPESVGAFRIVIL